MSSWRSLVLRIGENCSEYGGNTDYKDHLETFFCVVPRELLHSADDILSFLLQCAEQLPHKIPLYATLVGLLNLENEDFVRSIVDSTHANLQAALDFANCNRIRVHMRFLTVLQIPEEIDRVMVGIQAYMSIRRHVSDTGCSAFEYIDERNQGDGAKIRKEDMTLHKYLETDVFHH